MNKSPVPAFAHRQNRDGTIDAICTTCFVTIGNSYWEVVLEQMEQAHHCDPYRVAGIETGQMIETPADARFGT